jgi:hypothetical protein
VAAISWFERSELAITTPSGTRKPIASTISKA